MSKLRDCSREIKIGKVKKGLEKGYNLFEISRKTGLSTNEVYECYLVICEAEENRKKMSKEGS